MILAACMRSKIWNAGDLAEWAKDQAAIQGCAIETIQLDEWHRKEDGHNVRHGYGKGSLDRDFAIPVDSVWKPSAP
jgi:hypothetical protein